jgi:hypothetical protein
MKADDAIKRAFKEEVSKVELTQDKYDKILDFIESSTGKDAKKKKHGFVSNINKLINRFYIKNIAEVAIVIFVIIIVPFAAKEYKENIKLKYAQEEGIGLGSLEAAGNGSLEKVSIEEMDYYKYISEKLISKVKNEDLIALAKEEWQYGIEIDGKAMENRSVIEINKSSFTVTLFEHRPPYNIIPEEIFMQGRISGESYRDHIKFLGLKPSSIGGKDGTVNTSADYSFENLPKGTSIKLQVTEELKNRIGLGTTIVTIVVK